MISNKEYVSKSDEQVEVISRYYNIHYIAFWGSFIYLLYTRINFCFAVHILELFLSNPGEIYIEVLVQCLGYIRDNKNLGLEYYARIEDTPISYLFRQAIINYDNPLMVFYDSICN